jgi:tRNA-splicing ligase RtcB
MKVSMTGRVPVKMWADDIEMGAIEQILNLSNLPGAGQIGIIPGSQGTKSYIVRGLGNQESFYSCSHGAGRRMGRKEAQRKLNLVDEIKLMDDQGIVHGIRTQADLDEAAGAYKDIDTVMENQKDLVEIVAELRPLAVIKG